MAILTIKLMSSASLEKIIRIQFLSLIAYFNLASCAFVILSISPLDSFRITSEFFPESKVIENSSIGVVLLMVLFASNTGEILFKFSELIITWLT